MSRSFPLSFTQYYDEQLFELHSGLKSSAYIYVYSTWERTVNEDHCATNTVQEMG